jgi:type I restriction enzyme S subunit
MVNEHVFLLRSKELGQPFLYSLCQSEMLSHQLKSMGTSKAAQPGLNQQEILSCKYIAPPKVLSSAFNKLISPFINRRLALGLENQTLTQLRDTLLPKLMSGEIRLKDAEREVEAAV